MNRYRVLLPLVVHTGDGSYEQFEEFDKEFTAEDEAENLRSGLLAIVPREYRVIGESRIHEHEKGETFTAALTIGEEQHLFAGGHIERVESKPKRKAPPKGAK